MVRRAAQGRASPAVGPGDEAQGENKKACPQSGKALELILK